MTKEYCRVSIDERDHYRWLDDMTDDEREAMEEEQAYYDRKTQDLEGE